MNLCFQVGRGRISAIMIIGWFSNCHLLWKYCKSLCSCRDIITAHYAEKGTTEGEMVGWHRWLNGHEFEETLGDGEGQGSLVGCSPWGCRVGLDWVTKQQINHIKLQTQLACLFGRQAEAQIDNTAQEKPYTGIWEEKELLPLWIWDGPEGLGS